MKRHDFEPGKLVAALATLSACLLYAMDAGGKWDIPWFVIVPVLCGGLALAGVVSGVAYGIRRRNARR
ncbi:hypothetical protein [Streptomyces palmae]|uniref:Uncharacterized protein n=1 Tax=Streptomyces palmae TaxID=1701085 RepID=A0A4Z0GRM7_9ACTN|nr:hypothetical protein [Streptomyces palmae]TGA98831.1 hypothetical protein E4099_22705 [Streptomyces palmae]